MPKLSIVVPVYFNQDNLVPLYKDIKEKVFDVAPFEFAAACSAGFTYKTDKTVP